MIGWQLVVAVVGTAMGAEEVIRQRQVEIAAHESLIEAGTGERGIEVLGALGRVGVGPLGLLDPVRVDPLPVADLGRAEHATGRTMEFGPASRSGGWHGGEDENGDAGRPPDQPSAPAPGVTVALALSSLALGLQKPDHSRSGSGPQPAGNAPAGIAPA